MRITVLLPILFLFPVMTMASEISIPDHKQENSFHFPECPDTPNCVSSLARNPAKKVEPFPLRGTPSASLRQIEEVIHSMPRAVVISSSPDSIRAEFRSLLGFVDDILFKISSDGKVIHVRSASRKGHWDLGVNRRRVERIRKQYLQSGP